MAEQRKKYSREFKLDTLRLYKNRDKSAHEIEEDLGMSRGLLYRWKREISEENIRAFPGNGSPRDEELARLRRELAIVTEEREILRKAVAIFSVPKR
jgi:transposase